MDARRVVWRRCFGPLERFEQWGLVVGLALAPKPGDMIEHLDAEHAVIRYRVGALLKEARR